MNLINTDPLFVNPGFDFELQDQSPCINTGVALDAPTTDILGRPRDAMPDMGALEFGGVVSSRSYDRLDGDLLVYGNPVEAHLRAELLSEHRGQFQVQITNIHGSVLYQATMVKVQEGLAITIPSSRWPQGNYFLTFKQGSQGITKM